MIITDYFTLRYFLNSQSQQRGMPADIKAKLAIHASVQLSKTAQYFLCQSAIKKSHCRCNTKVKALILFPSAKNRGLKSTHINAKNIVKAKTLQRQEETFSSRYCTDNNLRLHRRAPAAQRSGLCSAGKCCERASNSQDKGQSCSHSNSFYRIIHGQLKGNRPDFK